MVVIVGGAAALILRSTAFFNNAVIACETLRKGNLLHTLYRSTEQVLQNELFTRLVLDTQETIHNSLRSDTHHLLSSSRPQKIE
jgi:hypothetical protein